ncbi:class I SAM-dependent methyltransferase [uncultured Psychroserpens sp.]|uniref:class I SAM-dependent methyltransferase n=1 Tax=uncultured Psychroserpens sp. TaxID=255436 RepID=UPI00262DFC6B|nr:class I SAM-dependent methyltransferase [uncultured Psychroserpens sp.]
MVPTKINNHFVKRSHCPVCTSENLKMLYSEAYESENITDYLDDFYNAQGGVEHEYLKGTDYSLLQCLNCDLVFQENIPNDDLMFRLYEQWIDANIVCKAQEQYPLWYHETYANQIIDLITFFKRKPIDLKVLDFGMGWGKWCLMAKAFGCQVYGLELSKARIDYAQKNGITVLNEAELANHKFDFINTDQVFEHVPNPKATLETLLEKLAINGVIKISVPNGNGVNEVLKHMNWTAKKGSANSLNMVAPLEHINCFKTQTILALAEQFNLYEVQIPRSKTYYKSKKDFIKKSLKIFTAKKKPSTVLFFKKSSS